MCVCNRFRPRILIDVTEIDVSTKVLGFNISMPIMIAPTAMQKMAHPDGKKSLDFVINRKNGFEISCQDCEMVYVIVVGELATARATSAAGTIMVLILSHTHFI